MSGPRVDEVVHDVPVAIGQDVVDQDVVDQDVLGRLRWARELTRDADAKASGLMSGAGVLAAVAALAATAGPVTGPGVRAGVAMAGAGLVVSLLAVLAVLIPRGGRPGWVAMSDPALELVRVAAIVETKHRLLRVAVAALAVAVLAGAGTGALVVAGAR